MRNTVAQGRARLRTMVTVAASLRTADETKTRGVVTGKFARRMLRKHGVRGRAVHSVATELDRIITA